MRDFLLESGLDDKKEHTFCQNLLDHSIMFPAHVSPANPILEGVDLENALRHACSSVKFLERGSCPHMMLLAEK